MDKFFNFTKRFYSISFLLAFVLTLFSSLLGRYLATLPGLKVIGAMVISLLLGMFFQFIPRLKEIISKDIAFISNKFLRLGIILLGFKLNIEVLIEAGVSVILLACFVIVYTIILTYMFARMLKVEHRLALLTAGGCGVCGAAAVMGISPQLEAEADESVLSVAIVAILGTVFTLLSVVLNKHLGLNPRQYGILTGSSLHEIAHVVAAAGASTSESIDIAIITKLARVLLLAPTAIIMALIYHKKISPSHSNTKKKLPIPYFMIGFLATSVIGTLIVKSNPSAVSSIKNIETLAFVILGMAMAALGYSVNFKVLIKKGHKIFLAATMASVLLYITCFFIAKCFFR